jgi:hypothetical protein
MSVRIIVNENLPSLFFKQKLLEALNPMKFAFLVLFALLAAPHVSAGTAALGIPDNQSSIACWRSYAQDTPRIIHNIGDADTLADQYKWALASGFNRISLHIVIDPVDPNQDPATLAILNIVRDIQASNITYEYVWLHLGLDWFETEEDNQSYLLELASAAAAQGLKVGIDTSFTRYTILFGSSFSDPSLAKLPLSYHGDVYANFDDFLPFGPWTKPYSKVTFLASWDCDVDGFNFVWKP